jgi:hypothetical protein
MSDDGEPDGKEAQAQRQETVMPLVWSVLGALLVIGFVAAFLISGNPSGGAAHSVVAPGETTSPRY